MPSVSLSISPTRLLKPTFDASNSSIHDIADRFFDRKMDYLTSLRPQIQNALSFLKKFDSIRSLDVTFVTDDDDNDRRKGFLYGFQPSLINWKTKFGFKLQNFVFLFAQSVTKNSDRTNDVTTEHDDVTPDEIDSRLYSSLHGILDLIEWGNITSCLLIQHPTLREVSISGSRKGGNISLADQQIVDLKSSLSPKDVLRIVGNGIAIGDIGVTFNVKSAFVPVLMLSVTGYVMNSVSLVVVRAGRRFPDLDSDSSDEDDDVYDLYSNTCDEDDDCDEDMYNDILNWDFDSDEEVFREAVISILVNHKDKMKRET